MENSKIEWTDHTFNPWWGCMKVSDGCKNCYAESLDNRYNHVDPHWGPKSKRKPMSDTYWKQPAKWNLEAEKLGVIKKVFCASMADIFEDNNDVFGFRVRLFHEIINTPNLIWQLLTKRPENISKLVPSEWLQKWPENVWIGTSVENEEQANIRIPYLALIPAKIKFISCEPLLGNLNLIKEMYHHGEGYETRFSPLKDKIINWVIVGGESGPNSRPMHPEWARELRNQCAEAAIPFFFKQWGEWGPTVNKNKISRLICSLGSKCTSIKNGECMGDVSEVYKLGKKESGSFLDGAEYKYFPL
jgi:protein gp37